MSATVTRLDDYRRSKKPAPLRINWPGVGFLFVGLLSLLIAIGLVRIFIVAPIMWAVTR